MLENYNFALFSVYTLWVSAASSHVLHFRNDEQILNTKPSLDFQVCVQLQEVSKSSRRWKFTEELTSPIRLRPTMHKQISQELLVCASRLELSAYFQYNTQFPLVTHFVCTNL